MSDNCPENCPLCASDSIEEMEESSEGWEDREEDE